MSFVSVNRSSRWSRVNCSIEIWSFSHPRPIVYLPLFVSRPKNLSVQASSCCTDSKRYRERKNNLDRLNLRPLGRSLITRISRYENKEGKATVKSVILIFLWVPRFLIQHSRKRTKRDMFVETLYKVMTRSVRSSPKERQVAREERGRSSTRTCN